MKQHQKRARMIRQCKQTKKSRRHNMRLFDEGIPMNVTIIGKPGSGRATLSLKSPAQDLCALPSVPNILTP